MAIDYRSVAAQAASQAGINPQIFLAQINAESGFNPGARSPVGATGIAQIMPATARGWGVNPNDPVASLHAAAKAMANYVHSYKGDYRRALAAYNAGPGAVAKYGGVPPYRETQNYVNKIMGNHTGWHIPAGGAPPFGQSPSSPGVESSIGGGNTQITDGNNRAALLMAMQGRREGQSLTNALGNAVLAQRMSTPAQQPQGTTGAAASAYGAATLPASPIGQGRLLGHPLDRPGMKTQPGIIDFASRVAGVYGQPITLGTGTAHNQFVAGSHRQSNHWLGTALDLPASGATLTKMGQAALIAAGMPAAQASKQTGGVFNVGGYNILFNTNVGGNHYNHLHVGMH